MSTLSKASPKKSRWNPYKIPRHVRREKEQILDGQVSYVTYSFTEDDGTTWNPIIDLTDGHVDCDCPDFINRYSQLDPKFPDDHHHCKHLKRAVANSLEKGELNHLIQPEPVKPDYSDPEVRRKALEAADIL